jgi:beta-galactosidase
MRRIGDDPLSDIEIANGYGFIDLGGFEGEWRLLEDGRTVAEGPLPGLAIAPGESRVIPNPAPAVEPMVGSDYWLEISFRLAEDAQWARMGHEVAWEQFHMGSSGAAGALDPATMPPLELAQSGDGFDASGEDFAARFDSTTGSISSFVVDGLDLLAAGPRPNFWRAPTDNDRGNDLPERCAPWKAASGNWVVTSSSASRLGPSAAEISFTGTFPDTGSTNEVVYTIYGNGEIAVDTSFTPGEGELPEMPRFGMQMVVAGGLETVTWYGRGPHESYWDRKEGARVGVWSGTVDEQFVDYSEPQENGNKTDVKWASLTNEEGVGLLITGEPLFSFSAHHFTTEDLENAKYSWQMERRDDITLSVDMQQTGVGGDDSWGARTHDEYTVWPEPLEYSFRLRGLRPGDAAGELARATR